MVMEAKAEGMRGPQDAEGLQALPPALAANKSLDFDICCVA